MKKTLYVVDGSYYMHRAYHALKRAQSLSTQAGMPTGALFAYVNMIMSLLKTEKPDYFVIAFDPIKPSFRKALYQPYKANRSEMDEDLKIQRPYFQPLSLALGYPLIVLEGFEADDVMGTLSKVGVAAGLRVILVSGDKDLMQLVNDDVSLLETMAKRRQSFDIQGVIDKFSVPPSKIADLLALAGDSSDNIPGVPGVGPKTAALLLNEFGDLDGIFNNLDKVKAKKRRENLTANIEETHLYKQLTEIRTNLELPLTLDEMKITPIDPEVLLPILQELEFHRHIKDLGLTPDTPEDEAQSASNKTYEAILDAEHLDRVIAELHAAKLFCVDLETTSIDPTQAEIVGVALAWKTDHGVYIPLRHRYIGAPQQLDYQSTLDKLKPLLESKSLQKVGQNIKYDQMVFARANIQLRGIIFDTMLASYLIDPNRHSQGMDALAKDYLRYKTITFEEVAGKGRKKRRFDEVEVERATPYAAEDADITLTLYHHLLPLLDAQPDLKKLLIEVELPLSNILGIISARGIRLDPAYLEEFSSELLTEMIQLEKEAREACDGQINNLNSPKQLSKVLYEDLGLKPPSRKKTSRGYSTNQAALEKIIDDHPLPGIILKYRKLAKLRSTYAVAIPLLIHPITQRVHTSFNQAIAATGRLSSSKPNLQNIPIRTAEGRRIRRAFIFVEGWLFLSADYSQIELRLMAHCSADPTMIAAFNSEQDIHSLTASEIFEVPLDEVTKDQRRAGKTINFGVLYGMGSRSLSKSLEISDAEAQDIIDGFFTRFSAVREYFDTLIETAEEKGFSTTIMGRTRNIPELKSDRPQIVGFGERMAINSPLQGSAADLIKVAMIKVQARVEAEGLQAKMLLQVHDELLFEVPPEEVDQLAALLREEMEHVWKLSVPLPVDVSVGENWAEIKSLPRN